MAFMTAKENWLRTLNGQDHPNVPRFTLGMPGYNGYTAMRSIAPRVLKDGRGPQGGKDIWGVNYVANEETGYASLPEPNNFILEDIEDWQKIYSAAMDANDNFKYLNDIDWEAKAKADYEASGIDREQSAVSIGADFSAFMTLIGWMGFNNGLMALAEDPETCSDMLNALADFYVPLVEKYVEYYKPDMLSMGDDICSKYNPFFGRQTLMEVFVPVYKKIAKPAVDRGIPIHWHICGRCEDYYPVLHELGVRSTDPAQESNDLVRTQKEFKDKHLTICGGFDWAIPDNWPNVTEDQIKQMVREHMDHYAPNGHYAWAGNALGRAGDETIKKCNQWIAEEVHNYGMGYYER